MTTITRSKPVYTVYVIELHAKVLTHRRFAAANPGYRYEPSRPPVYVGHTVHSPEKRFEQHRSGTKASRFTKDNVRSLRMDLAGNLVFATRKEAEAMEAEHAICLRAQGYAVWQN